MTQGCAVHGSEHWVRSPSRPRGWCARCSRLRNKARRGTLSPLEAKEMSREHPPQPEMTQTKEGNPLQDPQTLAQEGPGASEMQPEGKDTGEPISEESEGSQSLVPDGFARGPDGILYKL